MKITSVAFRDSVRFDGKSSVSDKDAQLELHPAGVLVTWKDSRVLVPFSNIKWMGAEK